VPRARLPSVLHKPQHVCGRAADLPGALEQPEDLRKRYQLGDAAGEARTGACVCRRPVAGLGQHTGEIEEHPEGLRRVEVVIHGGLEPHAEVLQILAHCRGRRRIAFKGLGVVHKPGEALEGTRAVPHALLREVDRMPIVSAEDKESESVGSEALDELSDREDVAQRFRHLLDPEVDHPVVEPVPRERAPGVGLGLGNLAFMVGKD
jgi:hypothetical protein